MKIKWCMAPEIWSVTEFFVILGHFLPFYPTNNPKNQNFEKMKKTPGDIIILHTCIKNHDQCYTIPEIWHMTDVIYISYFGPFSAILPPKSPKKQNFKKWKKKNTWRYYHFTNVYQKLWSHDVRFLRYGVGWMNGPKDGQKNWHVEIGRRTEKLTCRDRCST